MKSIYTHIMLMLLLCLTSCKVDNSIELVVEDNTSVTIIFQDAPFHIKEMQIKHPIMHT